MNYGQFGLCHFCEHHGPNIVFHSRAIELRKKTEGETLTQDGSLSLKPWPCVACNPLDSAHPGYITYTEDKRLAVVSSDKPDTTLYKRLHQACFQSLSSEVCPSRDSFTFFTDPANSTSVASFTFVLKDSSARGFRRLYGVVHVSPSHSNLMKSFALLETPIRKLATELQSLAARVYTEEELICSQRALRSAVQLSSLGTARSLRDLTRNPDIFTYLHTKFCEMLEICRNSIIHVHGQPPAFRAPFSKDDIAALRDLATMMDRAGLRQLTYHLMRGGVVQLQSDNLQQSGMVFAALNVLVPSSEKNSTLSSIQLNLQGRTLSLQEPNINVPKSYDQSRWIKLTLLSPTNTIQHRSRLVTRMENMMFMEDVPDSVLWHQLHSLHDEINEAAQTYGNLKTTEPSKLMQFFNILGYTAEDLLIFEHWCLSNEA